MSSDAAQGHLQLGEMMMMTTIISPFGHMAVGSLFRRAKRIHINRVSDNFHITSPSLLRSEDILVKGRKHPVVCQHNYSSKVLRNTTSLL
jgi:hypothetical protein